MSMRYTPTDITSTYAAIAALNANFDDIAALLEKCVFVDGTAPNQMEADLDMNHFKIQNVGTPVNPTDAARLADLTGIVHTTPEEFGAVGNGVADDTVALTDFFNHANANPGLPHLLRKKTYGITATLPTITASNVMLMGCGASLHDVVTIMTGTIIKWIGTSSPSATMLKVEPVVGAGNQRVANLILTGIGFDCNGLVGTGLSVKSVRDSVIDVCTTNALTQGVYLGVVATLGEARDLNRNRINLNGRQIETTTGYSLVLDGDSGANVSMNRISVDAQLMNSPAIHCINSDNNNWDFVRVFKGTGGTATVGMELLGSATVGTSSRAEIIHHFTGNVPLKAFGTEAYTVASSGNVIKSLDLDNSAPAPLLGTGAIVAVNNLLSSFTPSVTPTTGAITTSTPTGKYIRREGGLVQFGANVTITINGTGAGALRIGLPFTAAANAFSWPVSVLNTTTGVILYGTIQPNTNYVTILTSAGAYPAADGSVFIISGQYTAA